MDLMLMPQVYIFNMRWEIVCICFLMFCVFISQPQQPLWSYPLEAIVSLACTKDGVYLAGGAPSGNAYLWEVCTKSPERYISMNMGVS